jgi:hypothetical protein
MSFTYVLSSVAPKASWFLASDLLDESLLRKSLRRSRFATPASVSTLAPNPLTSAMRHAEQLMVL